MTEATKYYFITYECKLISNGRIEKHNKVINCSPMEQIERFNDPHKATFDKWDNFLITFAMQISKEEFETYKYSFA